MLFTGTYHHTIDAKNRLAIPSEVRRRLQPPEAGPPEQHPVFLYVALGESNTLCIYTEADFEKRAAELDSSEMDSDELLAYEQLKFSLAERIELDPQGRLRLPEHLLKRTKLAGEVVVLGVKDHLEVKDAAAWKAYVDEKLAVDPKILMNPRRAMRQRTAGRDAEA